MGFSRSGRPSRDRARAIVGALEPGEAVRWAGRPKAWRAARRGVPFVVTAVPFLLLVFFTLAGSSALARGDTYPLLGVPLFLVGLGMLCAPAWYAYRARRTAYVVTDRRVLVLSGVWRTRLTVFRADELSDVETSRNRDGTGDIVLARTVCTRQYEWEGGKLRTEVSTKRYGLFDVEDVDGALRAVRAIARRGAP